MDKRFNEIQTRNELADFLEIKRSALSYVLYINGVANYYKSFEIPKKNGETRKICAPSGILKTIQKKLSNQLYKYYDYICEANGIRINISHAFEKEKGIITNAYIHKNKKYVINVDLEDYFNSFHFGRVKGFFEKNKYFLLSEEVSTVIAQLTCFNGVLPQGAPTSPIITNLICQTLDMKVLSLAKRYHLDYTRYADDLTFSTNDKKLINCFEAFLKELEIITEKNGFRINSKKTRLIYKDSKQTVTGLVVNKKINVDNSYYKKVRAMAHHLYINGCYFVDGEEGTINQLEGMFSFINQIDKFNNKNEDRLLTCSNKQKKHFFSLNRREKEVQKFLFYNYFYNNSMPLIITEGKTDVLYIKAALKKHYMEYPNLIERLENGRFVFKVSFFKRSNRFSYFFNLSFDGADTIYNIYNFFTNNDIKNFPNYYDYFNSISAIKSNCPVMLLFDNEFNNKEKPISKLSSKINLSNTKIKTGGYISLVDNKLFLLTPNLVNEKKECEIEDLFGMDVLGVELGGKSFSKDKDYDIDKHFGKEILSKYVISNYSSIDFSNFRQLLDDINSIINESSIMS